MNVVRFHDGEQYKTAVADTGRKWVYLVVIDHPGVRKMSLPLEDARGFEPLMLKGKPYPLARAAKLMLATGRRLGITEGAREQLKAALSWAEESS